MSGSASPTDSPRGKGDPARVSDDGRRMLRVYTPWMERLFWVLAALAVSALAATFVFRVAEYAQGPAVALPADATELTASSSGVVSRVHALSGDPVRADQLLVQLEAGAEIADLDGALAEFEIHLLRVLADPLDQGARAAAGALRPQVERARARVRQKEVRAPRDGTVGDVRVRPGQVVSAGDPIVTLAGSGRSVEVLALLPGRYRPLLQLGAPMQLEINGFPDATIEATVASVASGVIGPRAAMSFLGSDHADTIRIQGPVVLVRAVTAGTTFSSGGERHDLPVGMVFDARIRIREERAIQALIPALRQILPAGRRSGGAQ